MSDQWLSIVEYARTYNVSDMTVRRRIKTGKLQAVLREGKYYIPVHAETPWRTQNQRSWDVDTRETETYKTSMSLPHTPPVPALSSEHHHLASEARRPITPRVKNHHVGAERPSHVPDRFHSEYPSQESTQNSESHLLKFCDGTLEEMKIALKELENYKKSLQSLREAQEKNSQEKERRLKIEIQLKDQEIENLKRQVEDLEMLVKVMDEKLLKHTA